MADDKTVVTKKTPAKAGEPDSTKVSTKKTPTKKAVTKKTTAAAKKSVAKKATAAPGTGTVTKKAAAKKAPARKTAPKAAVPEAAPSIAEPLPERPVTLKSAAEVTPEERYRMVQEAAYYRAERRNFTPGHAAEDWAAAEAEVDEMLRKRG